MVKKLKKSKATVTAVEDIKPTINVLRDIPEPMKFPWPQGNASVYELECTEVFELVPGKQRGKFMDEIYRILVVGGKAIFNIRYWNTDSAIQDYMCEWPPVCEKSFLYFNKGWREANNLKRDIKCDFDFTYGYVVEPNTQARSEEVRSFNIKHYSNVVQVLQVVMVKR